MNKGIQFRGGTADRTGTDGREQSLSRRLRSKFGHKCNDLVPSSRVFQHLSLDDTHDLGLRTVPLEKIVGSSGRSQEFDLSFRPRRGKSERWLRVARANGDELPPVALYKVGGAYFIEDGNHRVSVAKANGKETIEAFVIEIDASQLRSEPSCQRLGYRI